MIKKWLSIGILSHCFFSSYVYSETLHLAVASNFINPIKEVASEFESLTGHQILLSFGSSGKLFTQIKHHAPYDIFLSADTIKPQKLIEEKNALPDSLNVYAKGQLALWSMNPIKGNISEILKNARRIAIANPKLAPYGQAAQNVLKELALWNEIQPTLVQGESIGQAYQFTYSRNAELGFVALSQIRSNKNAGHFIILPSTLYGNINQAAVVLSKSQNVALAKAFMAFLMSNKIQTKIAHFGYSTPLNNP